MLVKNKASGEVETLRYSAAMDAVDAGTHEIVTEGTAGSAADADPVSGRDLDKMSKDELLAEAARRGVEVKVSESKADIIKAIEAK